MKRILTATSTLVFLALSSFNICAQSVSRDQVLKSIAAERAELQRLEDQFLSPADEDRAAFKGFLSQTDTGLIRLLPRDVYESEAYKKNRKTLTIRGGGAYYSFAKLTHEYGYGSDLSLDSGYLSVGFAGADYGLMIELGDLSLDEISIDHPSVRSLADYAAATQESFARAEHLQTYAGLIRDGATYKSRLPAKIGSTYLLRSINYDFTDVLVAFRVVRKDTDSSLIIAWKLLKRFPQPKLVRSTVQAAN